MTLRGIVRNGVIVLDPPRPLPEGTQVEVVVRATFSSPDAWARAIREWAESHQAQATAADWSRESIYAGQGE